MPSKKLAKEREGVIESDVNKEEEKRASEAALLDTVARLLRAELNQLEQPGQLVSKGDIERFLRSAEARPALNLCSVFIDILRNTTYLPGNLGQALTLLQSMKIFDHLIRYNKVCPMFCA